MGLRTAQKIVTPSFQQKIVFVKSKAAYAPTNSAVEATAAFDKKDALLVSLPLFTLTERKTRILIKNPHNHSYKVGGCLTVANFSQGEDSASNSKQCYKHRRSSSKVFQSVITSLVSCSTNRQKPAEDDGSQLQRHAMIHPD